MNDFVALSVRHRFATPGWDALKPYTVSYLIGWQVFESHVPPDTDRTLVREAGQLFTLLARDRVDVALYERWQGLAQVLARPKHNGVYQRIHASTLKPMTP